MKILVPIKRVPDPALKTKLKDDAIDLASANWIINPFDEYALETALRLLENGETKTKEGEIVVVTIGNEDAATQLRRALAMGADRAIRVEAVDANLDSQTVTKVLIGIYEQEKPDLVLMGKQAVDGDANQVGQLLAGKLGLPQATFAGTIELAADKASLLVGREVDAGVEYKRVPFPSVVTVDLRIVAPKSVKNGVTPDSFTYHDEPRIPSMKGQMDAKKKPLDVKALTDFDVAAPVVKQVGVVLPPPRQAGQIVPDVQTLVKKLVEEAKAL